jgi:hypothetical protein
MSVCRSVGIGSPPPSQASVYLLSWTQRGGEQHLPAVEMVEGANSDDWTESLASVVGGQELIDC